MDYLSRAKDVIQIEIRGLELLSGRLDSAFDSAITLLLNCLENKGKIVVTGIGKNLPIAEKISATLASTGATSVVLNPGQAAHGDIGIVQPGDTLIVISYSGASEEFFTFLPTLKRNKIPIIGFTSASGSPLAEICDTILDITVDQEACPFNIAPTASTTAALALGDAIAMVLLDARDIKLEDYARLHPGGAIGRTLLQRVSDIMRTDEQVASVSTDASVQDALIAMTTAKSGAAAIINADDTLAGIFTDGDLRRFLTSGGVLSATVATAMSVGPITLREDQLAVDVLTLYTEHQIDDVLVVSADNKLLGAVDIQDLPRFKII